MYDVCWELQLTHTLGLAINQRLTAASETPLQQTQQQFEKTGEKQRLFLHQMYQAKSWDQPRQVVIKSEAHAQGTSRRAFSTGRDA